MIRLRAETHSEPTQCGPDNHGVRVCDDGIIYGPCASEFCDAPCESMGECACSCHEVRA